MRGLFVISSLSSGGAERVLSNVLMGLPEDWEIYILLNDEINISYPYKGKIISLGMRDAHDREKLFYQAELLIKRFRKLRELRRNFHPDFCVSFLDSANYVNVLTKRYGGKTILSEHSFLSLACKRSWKFRWIVAPMVRRFYPKADSIILVSEEIKRDFVNNYGIKEDLCRVIYNGIEMGDKPEEAVENREGFTISTMGRLEAQKGQWHLIKAFAALCREHNNLRLVILGEGSLRKQLGRLTEKLKIRDKVEFKGFVGKPTEEIRRTDLFVFPSMVEGLPNALLEAMSCGVPVISADFQSGAREILAPGTDCTQKIKEGIEFAEYGVITPVSASSVNDSPEELDVGEICLVQAIQQMINEPDIRKKYSELSYERAKAFSVERMSDDWKKEITRVCGQAAKP